MMKRLMVVAAILISSSIVEAMPAWRGLLKRQQPDGTIVSYYLQGDEWGHRLISADSLLLVEDDSGSLRYMMPEDGAGQPSGKLAVAPLAHDPSMRTPQERDYIAKHKAVLKAGNGPVATPRGGSSMRRAKASDYQIGTFPTKGDAHGLIILAEFSDLKMTHGQEYHQRMMNEEGFADYAGVEGGMGFTGSARDYFIAQSGGLFTPTFDVVGPVSLSHNYAYYGRNDGFYNQDTNAEAMIVEACRLADTQCGIDFSQYDYDNDGYVDMVYVIFAGYGENAGGGSNTVWPKKWNLSQANYNLRIDERQIDVFACSAELFGNTGTQTASIAQFCHEFGHVLGFADHYNTTVSTQYNLGAYDLMDYGAYNNDSRTPPSYNSFERMTLGWLKPEELTEPADGITLEDLNESNRAFRLSTNDNADEFYLLENRQQKGWDEFLPGSGLMITHVDYSQDYWPTNKVNNDDSHKRFYLVCADNEPGYDVILEKYTERYDLFPFGKHDSFTDNSVPNAKPYTGEKLDKWVTKIENNNGLVSFDFMNNHLKTPTGLLMTDAGDTGFTATWTNNDSRTQTYNLRLTHMLREQELKMPVAETFDNMTSGSKEQPGSTDCSSILDDYMVSKGWTGQQVYMAGGAVMIGKAGINGMLQSPAINFTSYDRDFAVVLKAGSATGKQPVLTVAANGMEARHRLTSADRMYVYQFSGAGLSATTITISVNKERAFIDSLYIVRGTDAATFFPQAKAVSVTGEPASSEDLPFVQQYVAAEETLVEGVEGCSYTFEGLTHGECYHWQVQGVADSMISRYSDEREIVVDSSFADPDGVEETLASSNMADSTPIIYNVNGVRVSDTRQRGIYLIKNGNTVRKVAVK